MFLLFSNDFNDITYKFRILPRTTEHSQSIYWHFQILAVNWNNSNDQCNSKSMYQYQLVSNPYPNQYPILRPQCTVLSL